MKNILIILVLYGILFSSCNAKPQNIISTATIVTESTQTQTIEPTLKPTLTPQSLPTPYPYIINANFPEIGYLEFADNYQIISNKFSNINFDDLTSGRLLKFELDFISKTPVFSDQVENSKIEIHTLTFSSNHGTYSAKQIVVLGVKNSRFKPELRPLKIISFYVFRDEQLFENLGINPIRNDGLWFNEKWPFWLMTWAYHNPDGTVTLGHSLVEIFNYVNLTNTIRLSPRYKWRDCLTCELHGTDFKPSPEYLFYNIQIKEENINKVNHLALYKIYKSHPELIPDEKIIKTWVSNKVMPQELQFKLFGLETSTIQPDHNFWRF